MMLPVVLYGCGTWSEAVREKHGLTVCENRALKESGRRVRTVGACSTHGRDEKCVQDFGVET